MATTFTHPDLAADRDRRRAGARRVRGGAGRDPSPVWSSTPSTAGWPRPACASSTDRDPERRAGPPRRHRARPPARLAGATAPRWPSGLPGGPLRSRLTDDHQGARAGPAARGHLAGRAAPSGATDGARPPSSPSSTTTSRSTGHALAGWLLELHEVAGHDDERERITTRLLSLGLAVARRRRRHVRRPRHRPVARGPLELAHGSARRQRAGARGLPAGAREPRRHDRGEPARHHRGHRRGVPARPAGRGPAHALGARRRARACCPTTSATATRRCSATLGQQTGPARDLDVYVVGWDAYVAPLGPRRSDPGLDKVRQRDRAIAGAPPTASCPRCSRATRAGTLIDEWRTWLADPNVEVRPTPPLGRVVAKRIEKAQDKVLTDGRAITADIARRAAARPAQGHQAAPLPARVLRVAVPRRRAQGVREPAQGSAGQPRRAPGRRGAPRPAPRPRPRPPRAAVVDTDALLAMGRLSDQLERRRTEERAAFAKRFAAVRPQGEPQGARRAARRGSARG